MSQPLYQASNSSTSTLRPRNARLISYLDEEETSVSNTSSSLFESDQAPAAFPSRGVSPLPRLGRPKSTAQGKTVNKDNGVYGRSSVEHATLNSANPLWDSWSSLSGIASTLLGSDVLPASKGKGKAGSLQACKKNVVNTIVAGDEWGPATREPLAPIAASIEERQSLVQAKKREALLLANANAGRDALGKYKRRDSNSDFSSYNHDNQEKDSLVYVHIVQRHDTIAGVTIKYACQPEVFRKVNRFWPNDNIQTRKHVILPVEACSVRGKKADSSIDLLSPELVDTTMAESRPSTHQGPTNFSQNPEIPSSVTQVQSPSTIVENSRHESWMALPGFPEPVEMVRIPQQTLGYFPPARRKSVTTPSETSTPKSSFDMLRHPPTHAASLNASPVRRPKLQSSLGRQRSSSTATPAPTFADHLKGIGGVGPLRGLRTEPSRPGPGQDPLNRKFAQYLPDLAPPEAFPRTSLRPTPRATPRASTDSTRSTSSTGLGDVGGTIESWVRKLAAPKSGKSSQGRMGDLIELETNSEMGDLLEDVDGEQTPTAANRSGGRTNTTEEATLNERFPMRGRVRTAYEGAGKDKGG